MAAFRRALRHGPGRAPGHSPERRSTDPRLVAFARGLALGALVGAAIAGSTIWSRLRRARPN
jgi:hypothetical protein